jgi:hypothetical protein
MGPPSYMQSIAEQNIMRRMTVMSIKVLYKICSLSKIPHATKIKSNIIKMSNVAH